MSWRKILGILNVFIEFTFSVVLGAIFYSAAAVFIYYTYKKSNIEESVVFYTVILIFSIIFVRQLFNLPVVLREAGLLRDSVKKLE